MSKNLKPAQLSLVLASLLLIVMFTILVLEKNNITKLYTNQEAAEQASAPRPVNSVSYTPATSTEKQEGDSLKKQLIEDSNKKPSNQNISVSFSAATQDTQGGPVIVKAIISGASSGSCKLVLSKDGIEKQYTAAIVSLGTYYGCDGFSIPVSDLSTGSWRALLSVTNGNSSGSTEQQIEVSL